MNKNLSDDVLVEAQEKLLNLNTTPQNQEDVTKIVNDLNAGWRNQIALQLGMDSQTFQLAQGTLGLQTSDSSGLFRMADAVPSDSTASYYNPSSAIQFATVYNAMLHALLPSSSGGLRVALGPMYANWIDYRSADTSDLTQLELFTKWADKKLDPNQKIKALAVYKLTLSDPFNTAVDAYVDPANFTQFVDDSSKPFSLPTYSSTITNAKAAVLTNGPSNFSFDSSAMDTSSNGTTVSGSASGLFDIFSGGVGASFTSLNKMAAASGFTITGQVDNYGTLSVDRGGWYDASQLNRAFKNKNDNNIWDPYSNQGDWDTFFGKGGSLARRVSQMLLVTGYDITVTSKASYTTSQFQEITTTANVGFWPFFSAKVSTTHTQSSSHGANGELITRYRQNPGQIAIWGATVTDIPG